MSLNISLSDSLKQALEEEVVRGRHTSASAYVRRLIREDRKRRAREELEAKLLEGLKGPATEMTPKDWADIRREVTKRLSARGKRRAG